MQPQDVIFAAGVAFLLVGALAATASASPLKRAAGVSMALVGATAALAAIRAAPATLIAGVAVGFALTALGAALSVRLQESYGGGDVADFDAADRPDDDAEPSP